jgi:hypothetical protein
LQQSPKYFQDVRNALGAVHLLNKKKPSPNSHPWIDIEAKKQNTAPKNRQGMIDVQQNQ